LNLISEKRGDEPRIELEEGGGKKEHASCPRGKKGKSIVRELKRKKRRVKWEPNIPGHSTDHHEKGRKRRKRRE